MTCDDVGSCTFSFKNQRDGQVTYEVGSHILSVSPEGSFGSSLSADAPPYGGAIGNNGNTIIMNLSFDQNQLFHREIMIGVKCSLCTEFNHQQQYALTATKSGTGAGTIISSPAGVNCGDDCSETYSKVQKVKLTANADGNSTFTGWSGGGCSGARPCTVTVNAPITVTASFAAKVPDIAVSLEPLDFGGVKVGKKLTKTLKITNNGTGDLPITIDGIGGTEFSITGSSNITIKSKKSYNLKVTLKPTSTGSKAAVLRINSNDPDTPVVEVALTGTGQ